MSIWTPPDSQGQAPGLLVLSTLTSSNGSPVTPSASLSLTEALHPVGAHSPLGVGCRLLQGRAGRPPQAWELGSSVPTRPVSRFRHLGDCQQDGERLGRPSPGFSPKLLSASERRWRTEKNQKPCQHFPFLFKKVIP